MLDAYCPPQAVPVLDDIARTDGVAADLHAEETRFLRFGKKLRRGTYQLAGDE
jgi:hypothetical protein